MAYNSQEFGAIGYDFGFPFKVTERQHWMASSGISGNVDNVVNHYWNLAEITTLFKITTNKKPATYITGYAYNSDFSPAISQTVTAKYEVINSADEGEYPPNHRMAREVTGRSEEQTINADTYLMEGSGNGYTSCFVTEGPYDFSIPITIQPENTGAFVITSDSGVASHFENLTEFGSKKEFYVDYKLDMGSGVTPMITDIRTLSPHTWYMVPADGWEFHVETGRLNATYYEYPEESYTKKFGAGALQYGAVQGRPHPIR